MEILLEQYRLHLLSQDKEENTIKSYLHEVEGFLAWCGMRSAELSSLSQQTLIEYRDALLAKGVKVTTVNKSVSTLSTFFKWALSIGLLNTNFARRIRLPQMVSKDAPRWLSPGDVHRLLDAASRETTIFQRTRNEALLHVMLFVGARVDEISQLPITAVDGDKLHIYDDGTVIRTVPIDEPTQRKLAAWLEIRRQTMKSAHAASPLLFVTERSGSMQPRSIQFVVEAYSEKLGIPMTSQMLRNTFCRMLVKNGATIERVKELAGHKTWMTSYKYFRNTN